MQRYSTAPDFFVALNKSCDPVNPRLPGSENPRISEIWSRGSAHGRSEQMHGVGAMQFAATLCCAMMAALGKARKLPRRAKKHPRVEGKSPFRRK